MKKIGIGILCNGLILLFIFITSCCGQDRKQLSKDNSSEQKKDTIQSTKNTLPASDPYFVISRDTVSNNAPHCITRNMLEDRNGNMWFSSWQGIIKYDGKFYTNYTLKENLIKFHVFSILEDKNGNIWFGTIRGGLYKYDGKAFKLFTTEDGLASNFMECIQEDSNGNIWIGTDEGVSMYNGSTFKNFNAGDGLSNNFVHSIAQDKSGKLWIATHDGVSTYDGKTFANFTKKDNTTFNNVRSIIVDKNENIWIGSQDGLFRYDGKSLTNFTTNFIGYIFEDKAGNLWLSEGEINSPGATWEMRNGMALYRYDGISFIKLRSYSQVFGIAEDKAGNIWFGTDSGPWRYDGKLFTN